MAKTLNKKTVPRETFRQWIPIHENKVNVEKNILIYNINHQILNKSIDGATETLFSVW